MVLMAVEGYYDVVSNQVPKERDFNYVQGGQQEVKMNGVTVRMTACQSREILNWLDGNIV